MESAVQPIEQEFSHPAGGYVDTDFLIAISNADVTSPDPLKKIRECYCIFIYGYVSDLKKLLYLWVDIPVDTIHQTRSIGIVVCCSTVARDEPSRVPFLRKLFSAAFKRRPHDLVAFCVYDIPRKIV